MSQERPRPARTRRVSASYNARKGGTIPAAVVPLSLNGEVGLFAHQGGWDEFLLVAAPLGVIGWLLWVANKRVSAQLEEASTDSRPHSDRSESNPPT